MGSGPGSGPGPGAGRTPHGTRSAEAQGNRKALRPATGFVHAIERSAPALGMRLPHRTLREISSTASQRIGNVVNRLKLRIEECHAYSAWKPTRGRAPHPDRHSPPTGAMAVLHTNPASPWIEPLRPQPTEISRRTRGDSPHRWWIATSATDERCHWIDDSRPSRSAGAQAIAAPWRIPRTTGSGASSSQYTPRFRPDRRASAPTKGPKFNRSCKEGEPLIKALHTAGPNPESPNSQRR